MFTGLIEDIGTVRELRSCGSSVQLQVATRLPAEEIKLGDSIAVNGICLTVVQYGSGFFVADVSPETLNCSNLSNVTPGSEVNLERALQLSGRLGGHLVSGHVDGIGRVIERHDDARSVRFTIEAPAELARYIAMKGSITVDGTSLTVNQVNGAQFELNIVPHTMQETIMGSYQAGTQVNLEVDLIARYLERLMLGEKAAEKGSTITESFLRETGFIR